MAEEQKQNSIEEIPKEELIEEIEEENVEEDIQPTEEDENIDFEHFSRLEEELIQPIIEKGKQVNPKINKIFIGIMRRCFAGITFDTDRISYEDYMEFFTLANQIIPPLTKKLPSHDAYADVFYVGDTHGCISDTFQIVAFFLQQLDKNPLTKIVFVGDYVDRNPYDLQNLALLLALYIIYPDNVILLRGNHEDRTINEYYGFVDNLLRRYHEKGMGLYESILPIFLKLPLVEITQMFNAQGKISARVFSVHGGIPIDPRDFMKAQNLDEIESKIDCEKEISDYMDIYSVSMLWSDPDEMIQRIVTDNSGSGRMRFGKSMLVEFLKENKLHMVVRGHQKWNNGYKIFFGGLLYSLFSASKYDDRKKFDPKILQLSLGKAPKILAVDTLLDQNEEE